MTVKSVKRSTWVLLLSAVVNLKRVGAGAPRQRVIAESAVDRVVAAIADDAIPVAPRARERQGERATGPVVELFLFGSVTRRNWIAHRRYTANSGQLCPAE